MKQGRTTTFCDRRDAGRQLLPLLPRLDREKSVVVALPRGGVPVAEEIARPLDLPLDVILVRKVGLPRHPELAVAAVADGAEPVLIINREIARQAGLSDADIKALATPELAEIERRRKLWHRARPVMAVAGKTVVVVDDGVATGATMKAALDALRKAGAERLILAVPVAAPDALAELRKRVDEAICLCAPERFTSVGGHYMDFRQITDAEVAEALAAQATGAS